MPDLVPESITDPQLPPGDPTKRLRSLAHSLSNSLETILQAAYLVKQCKLHPNVDKWIEMIDLASQEAARTNREIREILRSQE